MALVSLTLERFRNFHQSKFNLDHRAVVIGSNGAGKSNLIEAIRLLSVGKSFKTSRTDDLVEFNQRTFRVEALLEQNGQERKISFFYGSQFDDSPDKDRYLTIDDQQVGWSEYWGVFPTVLFVPEDVRIITDGPATRRRYIDSILWQTNRAFRQEHLELGRVLKERSTLLFLIKINRAGLGELQPWNELLSKLAKEIRLKRQACIDFLSQKLEEKTAGTDLVGRYRFHYQVNQYQVGQRQEEEIRLAQNLVGPQRDELEIYFNNKPARHFSSRGQARSIIGLLKVAEAEFIFETTETTPQILLDDLFSELDGPTAKQVLGLFDQKFPIIATSIESNPLVKDWQMIKLGKKQ